MEDPVEGGRRWGGGGEARKGLLPVTEPRLDANSEHRFPARKDVVNQCLEFELDAVLKHSPGAV